MEFYEGDGVEVERVRRCTFLLHGDAWSCAEMHRDIWVGFVEREVKRRCTFF